MTVGMDVLATRRFDALRGKRVGLLSHQAARTRGGATSAQRLRAALGDRLVALYGPEHGFFGQAGAGVRTASRRHPDWGIPVHSLYGDRRKPAPAMLSGVDLMVCDLQDLGVRCYTYLATLRNMLEACREAGIPVLVTDRPIPLPRAVDGPMPEAGALGFVAPCAVPLVYGMTPAESARWMRHTLFPDLRLDVLPMEGWSREDAAWDGGRPAFLPPSPGIKTWESAMTYAATVFCEALPGIDCGRGTNLAFRVLGAPWLRAERTCARLAALRAAGASFTPHRYTAVGGAYDGRELDGLLLTVTDPARFAPATVSLALLQTLAEQYGPHRVWRHKGVRPAWFDTLYGTAAARRDLCRGRPFREIAAGWRAAHRAFRTARAAALLY
ncbi:MAG: DUF1343 domain-containing protein [Kiritimatiellia bacterium]|jgi:uncharacterized protein YbbC (DUF1343 family)|nr:DUF1343 domain-containing protein [Kiritimatiellia bacterium]